jgi:GMP synthase-like glutamine amidotransferase
MKPILLVRNDVDESFGVAPGALAWARTDLVTADAATGVELPPLHAVSGVVMFGGAANADQVQEYPHLARVRDYAREAVERRVPYLGICLGSQILARALGVPVVKSPVKEVGFEPIRPMPDAIEDPLLSLFADGDMVVQWHEDTHDLPPGATFLATSDEVVVQAYRVGPATWGIQFHQEVDAVELEMWIALASAEIDLEAVWGKSAERLREEASLHMRAHEERGRELFRRFAEVAKEHAA